MWVLVVRASGLVSAGIAFQPATMLYKTSAMSHSAHHDPFDVTWRERVFVLGSIFGALLVAFLLGLIYGRTQTLELAGLLPVTFFAAGKFLPIWGVTGQSQFSAWELGAVVWLLDTVSVLLIVYGLEGLYRFRALKRSLEKIHDNVGLVIRAYPKMRKAAVIGVVLFVLFPVAGTGAVGATFLGILLRLHRATLIIAVSIGGLFGGALMAFLAVHFANLVIRWQNSETVQYFGIAILATLVIAGVVWLNRAHQRALKQVRQVDS